MKRYLLIGAVMQLCLLPSEARSQDTVALPTAVAAAPADTLRPRPRVRSVEYSDAYATRLKIHRLGSYAMLPLFATEYYLGEKIIEGRNSPAERNLHVVVAGGIGALFAVNTVTGVWNLWESRSDPSDRKKRYVHAAMMLGADAGFALAAAVAGDDGSDRNTHKAVALTSIGIATAGTALMWFWR